MVGEGRGGEGGPVIESEGLPLCVHVCAPSDISGLNIDTAAWEAENQVFLFITNIDLKEKGKIQVSLRRLM